MLADLLPIVREWKPELIVHDAAELAGPIVAAVVDIPNVVKSFGALTPRARVAAVGDEVAPLWRSLRQVVDAVAALDVRLLVTVGPGGDPSALGDQPPHVLVERYVPQTLVLGRCDVVASHAGSGTVLGALSLGLPQLCLPRGADQFANAAAVARAGAGLALPPGDASGEAIAHAVSRLLEQRSFRDAATQ